MSTCTVHCIYILLQYCVETWLSTCFILELTVNRENKLGLLLSGLWHITVWIRITYKLCASEAMNLYDECSGIQRKILMYMPQQTRCVIVTVLTIPSVSCVMTSCVTHVCLVSVCVYTCLLCHGTYCCKLPTTIWVTIYTLFLYTELSLMLDSRGRNLSELVIHSLSLHYCKMCKMCLSIELRTSIVHLRGL